MFDRLRTQLEQSTQFRLLLKAVTESTPGVSISIGGLSGSSVAFVLSSLSNSTNRQVVVVTPDRPRAEQLSDDLGLLHGNSARLFLPGSESISVLRSLLESPIEIIVAQFDSIASRLPDPARLQSSCIAVEIGKDHALTDLVQQLNVSGYERRDFVGVQGEYSQRGGILDVFSYACEHPMRMEFLGDTVESIREFDPQSQRSIREITIASITLNPFDSELKDEHSTISGTLFDYLRQDAVIVLLDPDLTWEHLKEFCDDNLKTTFSFGSLQERFSRFTSIHVESLLRSRGLIDFNTSPQPSFNSNMRVLREHLLELQKSKMHVFMTCDGQTELKRLRELIVEPTGTGDASSGFPAEELQNIEFVHHAIHAGFQLRDQSVACYTEHQIFGRQKRKAGMRRSRVRSFSRKELHQLSTGDFVVHDEFGIGRFDGLKKISVRGVEQEVMKLVYEEKDTLYVNLNYLNKVRKYSSKDGHVPRLTRLGSQEWNKLKARARKRIQDIARDLIRLYARRKSSSGHAFQPDTPWQKELEASFIYEDTFDQAKATRDVKQDMEQPFPMDRLVCGDVGFGKTEVAVRAAFKAVMDGKQVAILVPTTILAIQHFNTFLDRTSRFTVRVSVLSRLKSAHDQKQILEQLKSGAVDIIIGTHRLLSKDVQFKDIGLLVIDEEHRFGVAAKEKLRHLRATVDTLTLTATPIPRTLHFSLLGARDLSIIATPPRNRLPIETEVGEFSEELIKDAVTREIHRGGQVYFVHDRVQDIEVWTGKLRALLPSLRIRHAHGQMHAHELEETMLDFQDKKLDVLVCTKIIESGLDIPNVNTIIINRADRFGMSELYQLKGRVGRSNVQAFAYLLVPPVSALPRTTIQRLQAVEEFTDLGSGFNLAMRDLEIRGAGNLLGAEQSGYIESMGFETYTRLLDEAVQELKEQEFKELFPEGGAKRQARSETLVEVELEALIPEEYIENGSERLDLYRRMYALSSHEQLTEFSEELRDRFGPYPAQVHNLLNVVDVRLVAANLGFRKVMMGKQRIEIDFPDESETTYYETRDFQSLMTEVSRLKNRGAQLKQEGKTLKLVISLGTQETDPIVAIRDLLKQVHKVVKSAPPITSE